MKAHQRRVAALERAEHDRIRSLPPRDWITLGYLTFPALTPGERSELDTLLARAFDDSGHFDGIGDRMTDEQRYRAVALVRHGMAGLLPRCEGLET